MLTSAIARKQNTAAMFRRKFEPNRVRKQRPRFSAAAEATGIPDPRGAEQNDSADILEGKLVFRNKAFTSTVASSLQGSRGSVWIYGFINEG